MQQTPTTPAVEIVVKALMLRKKHPGFPALAILDRAMRRHRGQHIDFGELARPPAPFAYLIAEALDGGMLRSDWEGLWRANADPKVRPALTTIWMDDVWPKFRARYALI